MENTLHNFSFFSIPNRQLSIKRNISFSPACYLGCSPSTQQYSKRIKIIAFSQEKVPPNMLTLTLMFDILIKRLRDVLTWSMKKRRESGKPSIIPARTLRNKVLQKGIDRYCFLQKGQAPLTLASN